MKMGGMFQSWALYLRTKKDGTAIGATEATSPSKTI
jgi:hypothetical protein